MGDVLDLVHDLDAIVWEAETGTWRFTFVSRRAEDILGYPLDRWFGEQDFWVDRIHPADRERALARARAAIRRRRSYQSEYRVVAADGRVRWFRDIVRVVTTPGRRPRLRGVLVDITERKALEARLERACEQERALSERLQTLSELRSTMLHAVSHELRAPLAAVLGSATTLERRGVNLADGDQRELLHAVVTNGRKLQRLLADLLDLGRIDRGILEPERVPTDVGGLVTRLVGEFDFDGRPLHLDAPPVTAAVDAAKVERIVWNLLGNAVTHTGPGTPIWVGVRQLPDGVLLVVEDAGPGVPPELASAIFEPFRRGRPARQPQPGAGIGLSLVTRFATLHGGRAWVEERDGGGASFRVLLPHPGAVPTPAGPRRSRALRSRR